MSRHANAARLQCRVRVGMQEDQRKCGHERRSNSSGHAGGREEEGRTLDEAEEWQRVAA